MESISRSLVGTVVKRACACAWRLRASLRFMLMPTIMLSTARMMLCLRACMVLFSSSTTGLLSLLSSMSLSRLSFRALYWLICPSMPASLMPVPEGMRSRSRVGSVR